MMFTYAKNTHCFLRVLDLTKKVFGPFVRNVVINMHLWAVAVVKDPLFTF